MIKMNTGVARVRNEKGEYEAVPALRGASSYELAKKYGYTGTEEEWYILAMSGDWPTEAARLETEKANKSDVYDKTKMDTFMGLTSRIKTGSYVGTGVYGEENKNEIDFETFTPKMVLVYTDGYGAFTDSSDANYDHFGNTNKLFLTGASSLKVDAASGTAYNFTYVYYELADNKLTWYTSRNIESDPGCYQMNSDGKTYYYLAIG